MSVTESETQTGAPGDLIGIAEAARLVTRLSGKKIHGPNLYLELPDKGEEGCYVEVTASGKEFRRWRRDLIERVAEERRANPRVRSGPAGTKT